MKFSFNKSALGLMATIALLAAAPALAQSGFNPYQEQRTIVLAPPTTILNDLLTSNTPIDIRGLEGIAKVDIFAVTNGGGTLTCTLETSPDLTNWTALANYALSTRTAVAITNTYWGSTNIFATNSFLLPGVWTTPTAATAGFASPYLAPAGFTNSTAITVTTKGAYQIGFNISDQPRYLHVLWTATSSATNSVVGAFLTARPSSSSLRN